MCFSEMPWCGLVTREAFSASVCSALLSRIHHVSFKHVLHSSPAAPSALAPAVPRDCSGASPAGQRRRRGSRHGRRRLRVLFGSEAPPPPPPPPPLVLSGHTASPHPRTNRTRRVPHPVLIGHAASLSEGRE